MTPALASRVKYAASLSPLERANTVGSSTPVLAFAAIEIATGVPSKSIGVEPAVSVNSCAESKIEP